MKFTALAFAPFVIALSACGGSTSAPSKMIVDPPPTAFENLEETVFAQGRVLSDVRLAAGSNPSFVLPTAPGSATYTASARIIASDAERAAGNPYILGYGSGEVVVTFDPTDPTMTGSFSNFLSRDNVSLEGSITIVSNESRNTRDFRLGPNAFSGTSTGTITGTGTGTVLDGPRRFDGTFGAFVVGNQGEGFNLGFNRMENGELVTVGSGIAVRNP